MTCHECRQQLVLAEEGGPVSVPAREHLEQCAACQEFVRDGEQLQVQMRLLAESEHAPEELHEQVQAMLDGQRRSRGKLSGQGRRRQRTRQRTAATVTNTAQAMSSLTEHTYISFMWATARPESSDPLRTDD